MDALRDAEFYRQKIYNDGWWVRRYGRGARSSLQRTERAQAIRRLGLTVREAFAACDDFETLLLALFDCLNHKDEPPPF